MFESRVNPRIFKYPLAITDSQIIHLPAAAQILSVQVQREQLCLWALVDANSPVTQPFEVQIIGTGNPVPSRLGRHVGTVQMHDGTLVWHVFIEAQ